MSNTDTQSLSFSTGFGSTASIDGNATMYAFPGIISETIPDVPGGLVAGIPGSQLYIKDLTGSVTSAGAIASPVSILSRKNDGSFLTPLSVNVSNQIDNVSTFEEIDSATLSNDGAYMAVVTNARSDGSVGFPGALGVDSNSTLVPPTMDTASVFDVFLLENLGASATWKLVSEGGGSGSSAQANFGAEALRQVQTPTVYGPSVGVTPGGDVRVAFAYEGDNVIFAADPLFGRSVYVKSFFATPASVAEWSSF